MQTWGLTDPGNIRQQNQDSYAIVPFARDRVLMIVCDGMGGAKSGNVASSLAVEVFTGEVRRTQKAGMTPEKAAAMLRSALELANRAVYEQSQLSEDFTGMGTTLVAAFLSRDLAVIINVGDSRAYIMSGGTLRQISEDHSYVEEMRRLGRISEADARSPPQKNLITRAVGVDATVDGDLFEQTLADGDILLLCSDGLTGMVEDGKIAEVLAGAGTLEDKGRELLTLALEGGGRDNITVALFTCGAKQEA